jgi:hypothetical protein
MAEIRAMQRDEELRQAAASMLVGLDYQTDAFNLIELNLIARPIVEFRV